MKLFADMQTISMLDTVADYTQHSRDGRADGES